mmetsp:Transcript_14763/g.60254  ORF Transcript_14763/g.60254 Transcript_14763/m.60254 type:complete len:278 (-) Transcript_14763:91-924(-)
MTSLEGPTIRIPWTWTVRATVVSKVSIPPAAAWAIRGRLPLGRRRRSPPRIERHPRPGSRGRGFKPPGTRTSAPPRSASSEPPPRWARPSSAGSSPSSARSCPCEGRSRGPRRTRRWRCGRWRGSRPTAPPPCRWSRLPSRNCTRRAATPRQMTPARRSRCSSGTTRPPGRLSARWDRTDPIWWRTSRRVGRGTKAKVRRPRRKAAPRIIFLSERGRRRRRRAGSVRRGWAPVPRPRRRGWRGASAGGTTDRRSRRVVRGRGLKAKPPGRRLPPKTR